MKNKLFAKKYYFCILKKRSSNDILFVIYCIIDTSLQIDNCTLNSPL